MPVNSSNPVKQMPAYAAGAPKGGTRIKKNATESGMTITRTRAMWRRNQVLHVTSCSTHVL